MTIATKKVGKRRYLITASADEVFGVQTSADDPKVITIGMAIKRYSTSRPTLYRLFEPTTESAAA
jgi:hypothetical protein